ncbi:MAG: ATP-binding protein, partial [Longispora sp.]|nr:ATP-binding protein [Longispora sp. (in: high G+C Gram-positive bacteria)]
MSGARTYLSRVTDRELSDRLRASGAVLIEGPKACGKTETARQQAGSFVLLDVDQAAQVAAGIDPALVLEGATPRLVDEWQVVPEIWNAVRRQVDERRRDGQFILTGSATPADDITRHTGAGRITRLRMRTMTMHETGHSSGEVSLGGLLDGAFASCPDPGVVLADLIELVCRGGWPASLHRDLPDAQQAVRDYVEEIRRSDIHTVDGIHRDPGRVKAVLVALARNVATEVSLATLAADAGMHLDSGIRPRKETVSEYLGSLE